LGHLKDWEDRESWRDFSDTYWRLIYNFAVRNGLNHEEAQEVVQETVVAVAKSIARFHYNPQVCTFKTWSQPATCRRRRAAGRFKRHRSAEPHPG
jgi:DNA-directed RNA polymerase specialized sigma24 family protein